MEGVGGIFGLPFKSPGWFGTFVLMGLIALIPIVGQVNMYGWILTQLDYYRQGRTDVPPAGFYLGRGINVFLASIIWALPILLLGGVAVVSFIGASVAGAASCGSVAATETCTPSATAVVPGIFSTLLFVLIIPLGLLLAFLQPAIWVATERGGLASGLNPAHVFGIASKKPGNTLVAALLEYVAGFIAGLGVYLCCVGALVTIPYGYLLYAGILRHYEYSLEPPAPAPPTSPAPA